MSQPTAHHHRRSVGFAAAALLAIAGCTTAAPTATPRSAVPSPSATQVASATATVAPTPSAAPTSSPEPTPAFPRNPAPIIEGAQYTQVIDPAAFVTGVDNPFLPLAVGTRWIFEGDEHVEVEVLSGTKVILGVNATVVSDRVFQDGKLIEDTLDWYAQDVDGNVWYFGEDTKEFGADGAVSTTGSWEGGVAGAQPGIVMKAHPKPGGGSYRQEYRRGEAEDQAEVVGVDKRVSVRFGSFTGVVVTKEFTALEPGLLEHKYYARDVGLVRETTVHGGSDRSELVELRRPSA